MHCLFFYYQVKEVNLNEKAENVVWRNGEIKVHNLKNNVIVVICV